MARPGTPLLSVAKIVTATLEIIDKDGDFSFPKIARKLGVSQSSVHHHVGSRAELIELLRAHIGEGDLEQIDLTAPWDHRIEQIIRLYRANFARHPKLAPLLSATTVQHPDVLEIYEAMADALLEGGFRPANVLSAVSLIDSFSIGSALELTAPAVAWSANPTENPKLHQALDAAASPEERAETAFKLGLETLMLGLRAQASRERAGQSNSS
ncbi:MAG: TetR/AcrR family transcriptional regulator [Gulosibacter sp.]|uniref:TetR/AcrR family transcriptional regulator n=1 Tax=Gulosibacter sp. TaxID=2817531 RepID=UPI003F90379D